ncbi:hypothetical protein BGX33_011958 [Mortierella sp. NVP41]|nr:hypothetical protein BGX33_011958 [Mortierella sp. NVP41]
MRITSLSVVLCLAATTVLADNKNTPGKPSIYNHNLSVAASIADKREAHHHEINGATVTKRANGPKGVNRHEEGWKKKNKKHNEHGVEAHGDGGDRYHSKDGDKEEEKGGDKGEEKKKEKKGGDYEDEDEDEDEAKEEEKKGGDNKGTTEKKKGGDKKGGDKDTATAGDDGKAPVAGTDDKETTATSPAAGGTTEDGKKGATGGVTNPSVPRDYASPLWLVQPFGSSIWAQGETYVVSWDPNPDPLYAKSLAAKTSVEVRLMQEPPDNLKEIAVISKAIDESLHMLEWTVPTTVAPATDYSIRLSHPDDLDTYSHYFEVVMADDPRSSKSNVGEPLQMPQKGDIPQPLNKGPINKPASPPNPVPAAQQAIDPCLCTRGRQTCSPCLVRP